MADDSVLLTKREFCSMARIAVRTFDKMRQKGSGPVIVKIGTRVFVRRARADEWIAAQEVPQAA